MKRFLLKFLYFLLPFIGISYLLDVLMSNQLKRSDKFSGELEVWNDIYDGNIDCEIAIYGSSRAWIQFDPEILSDSLHKRVYNFGIDGHNFYLQYLRHREYIKHNHKPETIILSVDMNTLQKREDLFNLEQFLPYILFNGNIFKYTSSYIGFNWFDYYLPLIRYFGKKTALKEIRDIALTNTGQTNLRKNGYRGRDESWNNDFEKAKQNMPNYKISIDIQSVKCFETFLEESRNDSVNIVLVYAPEYFEGQNFSINRKESIKIFKEKAKNYDFLFLDYSDIPMNFNKDYFYNATHLNKKGAEFFTSMLAHDLKRIKDQNSKFANSYEHLTTTEFSDD